MKYSQSREVQSIQMIFLADKMLYNKVALVSESIMHIKNGEYMRFQVLRSVHKPIETRDVLQTYIHMTP